MATETRDLSISISKDWIILVPLFGSGLAVIYDVGFFSGLNLSFFTFFSLAEHIVFALTILPTSILATVIMAGLIYLTSLYGRKHEERKKPRYQLYSSVGSGVLIFGVILILKYYFFGAPSVLFTAVIVVLAGVTIGITVSRTLIAKVILGICFVTVFFYSSGLFFAFSLTERNPRSLEKYSPAKFRYIESIELNSGQKVHARILRSGDRGILYFNPELNYVAFIQWQKVAKITWALQ